MHGSTLTLVGTALSVISLLVLVFVARFVSKTNLPSVAADMSEVYERRITQLEAEVAERKASEHRLTEALQELQFQYATLMDFVARGGTGKCAECPLLQQFNSATRR